MNDDRKYRYSKTYFSDYNVRFWESPLRRRFHLTKKEGRRIVERLCVKSWFMKKFVCGVIAQNDKYWAIVRMQDGSGVAIPARYYDRDPPLMYATVQEASRECEAIITAIEDEERAQEAITPPNRLGAYLENLRDRCRPS